MQLPLEYLRSEVVEGKIVPLMLIAVVCTSILHILQSDFKSEKRQFYKMFCMIVVSNGKITENF